MTYQEMLEYLQGLDEPQRRAAIQQHWQNVLANGFIAFVQGSLENFRKVASATGEMEQFYANVDDEIGQILRDQASREIAKVTAVWESMKVVYQTLQAHSERQGSGGGMVDHGPHTSMPRGVEVSPAARCYRCGAEASDQGLCSGCLATEKDWRQDDLDYDRQLQDQQRTQIEYQRTQDDQSYNDQQVDFNTSYDSGSDY